MKVHLSLNVKDLAKSVDFYRRLFGQEPAKHHADYAKFEIDEPPLVLALEPTPGGGPNRLNHLGLRYERQEQLMDGVRKVYEAGLEAQLLQGVECCYSRQSKAVLADPDDNMVELYILEADLDHAMVPGAPGAGGAACTNAESQATVPGGPAAASRDGAAPGGPAAASRDAAAPVVWEHLLGRPFPNAIDAADGTLDEVKLRGTLNHHADAARQAQIFAEAARALKPGGRLMMHLLVSDRLVTRPMPKLPGPAANVDHTPVGTEVLAAMEDAGFVAIQLGRLSHAAVFQFDGAEMRELLVTAAKKADRALDESVALSVVYKGPFRSVSDDFGTSFKRGQPVAVSGRVFETLKSSALAPQFVFLTTNPAACGPG